MCSSGAAEAEPPQPSQQQRSKGLLLLTLPFPFPPSTLTEISRGSEAGRVHRRPYGPRLREASPQGGHSPSTTLHSPPPSTTLHSQVRVSAKLLLKEGVLTTISLPPKMVSSLFFDFSSVRSGTPSEPAASSSFTAASPPPPLPVPFSPSVHPSPPHTPHYTGTYSVLGMHVPSSLFGQGKGRSVFLFELKLEELLNMQHRREFVLDQGKLKLDVAKTLTFLNERMRF